MWLVKGTWDIGYLPDIILEGDMRPAAEQIAERYAHGGGYNPFGKGIWTVGEKMELQYPGDPPLEAKATLIHPNGEIIILYVADIVGIFKPDKTFDVVRLD